MHILHISVCGWNTYGLTYIFFHGEICDIYIHIYIHTYMHTYIHLVYIHIHRHLHIYIYTYIYIYIPRDDVKEYTYTLLYVVCCWPSQIIYTYIYIFMTPHIRCPWLRFDDKFWVNSPQNIHEGESYLYTETKAYKVHDHNTHIHTYIYMYIQQSTHNKVCAICMHIYIHANMHVKWAHIYVWVHIIIWLAE